MTMATTLMFAVPIGVAVVIALDLAVDAYVACRRKRRDEALFGKKES